MDDEDLIENVECHQEDEIFDVDILDWPDWDTIELNEAEIQVVYYVSGYCAFRVVKMTYREHCQDLFRSNQTMPHTDNRSTFFDIINRGRLRAPSNELFLIFCSCYKLFCQLKNSQFYNIIKLSNPAVKFRQCILERLKDSCYSSFVCKQNHDCWQIISRLVLSFFNTLARNFVRSKLTNKEFSGSKKIIKLTSKKSK